MGGVLGKPTDKDKYYYYKSAKVFHTTNGAESAAAYLGKRLKNESF